MKIAKPLKVIGMVALSLFLLAVMANIAINLLIKTRLPKIIEERNDTAYNLTYEDMNFSIFNNSLSVDNAVVVPKKEANIDKEIDFYGKVQRISVSGVNFYELLKNKNLKAFTVSIIQPEITIIQSKKRETLDAKSKLTSVIDIDRILVQKAHLRMMNPTNDTLLNEVFNFNSEINGVHMGEYTAQKDIPFTYTDYRFEIDSLYSMVNDLQIIKSGAIAINKENIAVTNFRMLPYKTAKEFRNKPTANNTRLFVEVPKLTLTDTDWGYNQEDLFVKVGAIAIDSIDVKILDQKQHNRGQEIKKEYSKSSQPLIPFKLDVEELTIQQSTFNSLNVFMVNNVNISMKRISNRVRERLLIEEFQLNNPQFVQIATKSKPVKRTQANQLNDKIQINKVEVNNANYVLKNGADSGNKLEVNQFNLSLNNVWADNETVLENVPFTYKNPKLSSGKVHWNLGKDYDIYLSGISVKEHNATVKNFRMLPKKTRKQHAKSLQFAQDQYHLQASKIDFNQIVWGFDRDDEFYVKFKEVVLNQLDASIYRDISVPLNPKENHLYSYRLRELNFPFEIGTLKILDSKLTYEEDSKTTVNPGKLSFTNFNLTAQNLYSGYKKKGGPQTKIVVHTQFMGKAGLVANWQFNIMDKTDRFQINGRLKEFPAAGMNPFIKPYINVEAEGAIDQMRFDFSGNNEAATGKYAMDFTHLKMTLFNKKNEKRKFLTAATNMILKTDTDGLKEVEIKPVNRKKDRSFFNFLWLCIMQGLKQTVI